MLMERKNILIGVFFIFTILVAWLIVSFSLCPYVCSMPNPDIATNPPKGKVSLSAIQMNPKYRLPVIFTEVQVQDLQTGESLSPELVLYNEEDIHFLMASSWVGTREEFIKDFSESSQLPIQGAMLCSKNIVLGTLWTQWPEWNHPTKYTISYKLLGIIPKQESIIYHWDKMETEKSW